MTNRKEYIREYQRKWMQGRRLDCIEILGGKCAWCGSTENLEIDHIDPKEKKNHISQILSRKWEIVREELKKCQLLCESCHMEKSKEEKEVFYPHGTLGRYERNCRCDLCRRANTDVKAEYKKAKSAS